MSDVHYGGVMQPSSRLIAGLAAAVAVALAPVAEAEAQNGDVEVIAEDVPQALTHQGRLVDDDARPISGDVELTYTIWDHPTDGAVVWQDVVEVEVDDSGFYSVELGGQDNPVDPAVLAGGAGWLGVEVDGGDELEPRISLNSVPYAVVANEALRAGQAQFAAEAYEAEFAEEAQLAQQVADGSVGSEALADDFEVDPEHVEEATGQTLGGLMCDSGQVASWDDGQWGCIDQTQGTVTDVTASSPLNVGGPQNEPEISLPRASASASGYLHPDDFSTFDSRLDALDGDDGVVVDDAGTTAEVGLEFGDEAGTVVEGDDERLSDARDPIAGSDHYIQNQDSTTQDAAMAISGEAAVGSLDVDGDTDIDDDLTVDGTAFFDITDVNGFASFGGDVDIAGDAEFDDDVTVGGSVEVDVDAITDDDPMVLENTSSGRSGDYQTWEVPETGMYRITAQGAAGGATNRFAARRSPGAQMRGDFFLEEGDELIVLVGQRGVDSGGSSSRGGGGGGTFVTMEVDDSDYEMNFGDFDGRHVEPLIVAGGGAGAHEWAGGVGQIGTIGHAGQWVPGVDTSGTVSRTSGGEDGDGGEADSSASYGGAGGAGFVGDGESGSFSGDNAQSFLNGGVGGEGRFSNRSGGFGGGGGSTGRVLGGGGGGGWSGGAGGVCGEYTGDHEETQAGGGGGASLNTGQNQVNHPGVNRGHGEVVIEQIGTEGFDVASDRPGDVLYTSE